MKKRWNLVRIGNRAVREAQAENHRLGLPKYLFAERENYLRDAGWRNYYQRKRN